MLCAKSGIPVLLGSMGCLVPRAGNPERYRVLGMELRNTLNVLQKY